MYQNGDYYSGSWRQGRRDGRGMYSFKKSGMRQMGLWIDSKIVEGYWIYPNGLHFEGKFENNRPVGAGVWHFRDGTKLEGLFEQKPKDADLDGIDEDKEEEEQKITRLTERLGTEIEKMSRQSAPKSE